METSTLSASHTLAASLTTDECLSYRFNLLRKTNRQTKELNFRLLNLDKEKPDAWLHRLEPHLVRCEIMKIKLPFRFNDKIMTSVSHVLYKLDRLKELKVSALGSRQLTGKGMIALNHTLSKLTKLTKLKLDFSQCSQIGDQALTNLGQCIYRLHKLEHISLTFSGCNQITDDSIIKFSQKLAKLPQVKDLTLIFNNCSGITDKGITELYQAVAKMTSLTSLATKFYRCSLTDDALISAGQNILKLEELRVLSITVSSGEKTNYNGLTAVGTNSLCNGLIQLQNLEALTLKFGWSRSLSDEALSDMNQSFLKFKKLKDLQIGCYYCREITDQGIRSLTKEIHRGLDLQSFRMNLWSCDRITDEAFINLAWVAIRLRNLKNCQLASERLGWLSFNDKKSLLQFSAGLSFKQFTKNTTATKMLIGTIIIILLFCLLTPLYRLL